MTRAADAESAASRDRRRRPRPQRTSFIGREAEIASLLALVRSPDVALVTITGRSGAGKTRLAVEIARRVGADVPGGAVIVDCASIDDPDLLVTAVAGALDLNVVPGRAPGDALRRSLQYEPTLILADDLDHVPGGVEDLLDILDECPGSHVLATATAPLRSRGEHVVRLGTLPLPPGPADDPDVAQLSPAVALFCERASAVDAGFRCTRENVPSVARLVERLDGLPLAIELAAARVTTLSPAAQLEMLETGSPLDLTAMGPADADSHRTGLRSAIAWSHRLLDVREQALFRRMGAFEGGCALDAVREVCADRAWGAAGFLDALTTLVDVHLVEPDTRGSEPRYRLVPTVAEYARELLAESGETGWMLERHAGWFIRLARDAASLDGPAQVARLAVARDNLHAVLGRCVAAGDLPRGLELAADLAPLWHRQGFFPRTRVLLDSLLAEAESRADANDVVAVPIRARALLWRALLSADEPVEGDRDTTGHRLDLGLALARASGDDEVLLFGLSCVIRTLFVTRDMGAAAGAAREGLALARTANDAPWETRFMCWAGMLAQQSGDMETAARLGAESLERARRSRDLDTVVRASVLLQGIPAGTPGLPDAIPTPETLLGICRDIGDVVAEGWMIGRLAWASLAAGDRDGSAVWCVDGLRLGQRTGALSAGGFALANLVVVASGRTADAAIAAVLHGALTTVLPVLRVGLTAGPTAVYLTAVDAARARMGDEDFDAVVAEGTLLPWDAALAAGIEYASDLAGRALGRRTGTGQLEVNGQAGSSPERLTPREIDVLRLLARGDTNKDIAAALGLRPKTVMHHSVSIYGKLGVRGRAEAAAWAVRSGLLDEAVAG
jgi:predicted ATPase/DNA-binding CsgD family transcriptional regulator